LTLVLLALPFFWVAIAMSLKRCRDAGWSPWWSLAVLVPIANLVLMFLLSAFPTVKAVRRRSSGRVDLDSLAQAAQVSDEELNSLWQAPQTYDRVPRYPDEDQFPITAALLGLAAGTLYAICSTVFTVYVLQSYGLAVFFGTPFVSGAICSFVFNVRGRKPVGSTLLLAVMMAIAGFLGMFLAGFEGAICLVMAAPITLPTVLMGAMMGRAICVFAPPAEKERDRNGMMWVVGLLPGLAAIEPYFVTKPELSITSVVEVNAPALAVWEEVIAFPEITTPPSGLLRMGIASPLRARIEGEGVGATRYCEFTTGTFVEPVTVWDPGHRLAFDVSEQPDPMFELSPYRHIHPPHLKGSFLSTRGEFQLEELGNGRTRLSGTTWYTLQIHPQLYWSVWTDELVHQIHMRVLEHIRQQVEREAPMTSDQ
jgi:hypothetical protein